MTQFLQNDVCENNYEKTHLTCRNAMSSDDHKKIIIVESATPYYKNCRANLVTKDFSYSLRCVINQLKLS